MGNKTSKDDGAAQTPAQEYQTQPDKNNETMQKIQHALEGTAKTETDGLVGCKSRSAAKKREKERKAVFDSKLKDRSARTSKISQQWAAHRDQNAVRSKKSMFGSQKVEPKHWYDD